MTAINTVICIKPEENITHEQWGDPDGVLLIDPAIVDFNATARLNAALRGMPDPTARETGGLPYPEVLTVVAEPVTVGTHNHFHASEPLPAWERDLLGEFNVGECLEGAQDYADAPVGTTVDGNLGNDHVLVKQRDGRWRDTKWNATYSSESLASRREVIA